MSNRNTLDLGKPDWKETATREELIAKIENQRVEINNLLDLNRRSLSEIVALDKTLGDVRKAAKRY